MSIVFKPLLDTPECHESARILNLLFPEALTAPPSEEVWAEVMRQVFRGDEPSEGMPDCRPANPRWGYPATDEEALMLDEDDD